MRLLRSGTISLGSQFLVSGANFLATIIPAKSLDQLSFGQFILAQASILLMSSLVASAVLLPIRIRGVGLADDRRLDFFDKQCALVWLLVVSLAPVGFALQVMLVELPVKVAAASIACFGLLQFVEFGRAELSTRSGWMTILRVDAIVHSTRIGGILLTSSVGALNAESTLLMHALGLLISLILFKPAYSALKGLRAWTADAFRRIWEDNRWYLYESIVFIASTQTFVFVLGRLLSPVESGALGAFQQLTNVVNVFHMGIVTFVTTLARSALVRGEYSNWIRINIHCLTSLIAITVLMMGLLIAFGPALLSLLYTKDIAQHSSLLVPLAFMSILWAANMVWTMAFRVAELPNVGMAAKAGGALVAIVGAAPLIKIFGLPGAVYGMVATQLTWFFIFCYIAFAKRALARSSLPWHRIQR